MERLNKLYIKGRIEEDFYNKEYERLQKEISLGESESANKPKYNIENFKEIFPTSWKGKYVKLPREIKRNLWKEIISSIEINNEKTVERLIFK